MTKSSTPTKAELHEMLAEAVRNTQPQQVPKEQPVPKRNTRPAPKRRGKIKSVRASPSRKRQPR
jgi:hypothetical protein